MYYYYSTCSYLWVGQILQLIENDFGNGFLQHFTTQTGRFNEFVEKMYGSVYVGREFLFRTGIRNQKIISVNNKIK